MIAKVLKELEYLANHGVEIGILAIDKDKKGVDNNGKSTRATILEYAIYNEYGTKHIPARPFMRNTIDTNKEYISNLIQETPNKVLKGELTGKEALMRIGESIRGMVILSIQDAENWATPNSAKTLKIKTSKGKKENTKILIDTGYLINAIRYQIVNKNGTIEYLSDFKEV